MDLGTDDRTRVRKEAVVPRDLLRGRIAPDHWLLAAVLVWATRSLVVPYPVNAPWYESSALFPRLALGPAVFGGLAELLVRRRGNAEDAAGAEELDSSAANLWQAGIAVALFMAYTLAIPWLGYATCTILFVVATGRVLGLQLREVLLAVPLTIAMWLVFVKLLKAAFGHALLG